MQPIDEVIFPGWLLDVLYLFQILVHVFRVNVWNIELVQVIDLFNDYSNLVFFAYVHCLAISIVFLIVIRCFHRQREAWITREKNSLPWLIRCRECSLKDLKDDATHTPHILCLVILFLQQRDFWSSVPSGTNKIWDRPVLFACSVYDMCHFLQENLSHIILQEVRVESTLSNRVPYSCGVATALTRKILRKRSGNAKITNFDPHICSYKEIGGLNISMDHI